MWSPLDLYEQRPIPLGERSNAITRAYVEMDLVVHGPAYPLDVQHPCARDSEIVFYDEGHRYIVTSSGAEVPCMSVTTFVHTLFPPFEGGAIAGRKACTPAALLKNDYGPPAIAMMALYLHHNLRSRQTHGGTHMESNGAVEQVWTPPPVIADKIAAFVKENPDAVWPSVQTTVQQLHSDTRVAAAADVAEYTLENLTQLLQGWFRTTPEAPETSPIVQLATTALRYAWFCNAGVASTLGTYMHENIENYYNQEPYEMSSLEWSLFAQFKSYVWKTKGLMIYRVEWKVHGAVSRDNPQGSRWKRTNATQLVGTIDAVFWDGKDDRVLYIYDWKRSKKLTMPKDIYWRRRYGTAPPSQRLEDCNFHHYSLQLNTYKLLLERYYDRTVKGMYLVVLHPRQETPIIEEVYTSPTLGDELYQHRLSMIESK